MECVRTALQTLLFATILSFSSAPVAAPWIDPGDGQLRHHVQVLADAGLIKAPITTWPLMWGAIARDIEQPAAVGLDHSLQWSLAYVRFALNQATDSVRLYSYAGARSDAVFAGDFSSMQREKYEIKNELDWVGGDFAARLRFTWAPDALDDEDYRLDGSYVAGLLGNWSASVGAIERWWGPGWQNSLNLSSSARPVNAAQLQRHFSDPFETAWLSWIGPWTLTMFAGQLESSRAIPEAKLLGARLAIRPLSSLEIGFARTAMWGGEGRPESLDSLWDLVVGDDNTVAASDGTNDDPANQIGVIDWRWSFPLQRTQSAFYGQYAGEDESNGFPIRAMHMVGLETAFASRALYHRAALEYVDTMAGGHNDPRPNVAYEHSTYQTGYRYRARPLGSAFDSDTRALSLLVDHYFADGDRFSWKVVRMHLNRDGESRGGIWGGSVFGATETDTLLVEAAYSTVIKDFKFTLSVYNVDDEIIWNDEKIDGTGAGLAVEHKFQ